jgi:hypothetical protein
MTIDQVARHLPERLGKKMLTFDEVVASRRPAVFQDFGDLLLYLHDTVYVLQDTDPDAQPHATPPALDPHAVGKAIGMETGWRHAAGCDCPVCADDAVARVA